MKTVKNHLAERIAGRVLYHKRKAADYLNKKTANTPRKRVLALLFLFCLASGAYCLYLVIKAFY